GFRQTLPLHQRTRGQRSWPLSRRQRSAQVGRAGVPRKYEHGCGRYARLAPRRIVAGNLNAMERSLIIVEDDAAFAQTLARSFRKRGYAVEVYGGVPDLKDALAARPPSSIPPHFAVVDLKVIGGSGL